MNTPLMNVKAMLPVAESFGFTQFLREATQGNAFPSLAFDSWEIVKGSPFDNGSYANQIVMDVRKRKGLKLELPNFNDYCDKL